MSQEDVEMALLRERIRERLKELGLGYMPKPVRRDLELTLELHVKPKLEN
jgi:hypothetical protein